MKKFIFEKPKVLELSIGPDFRMDLQGKKIGFPFRIMNILRGDTHVLVLSSKDDFIDLKYSNNVGGKVPYWHRDNMPIWASYKPKGLERKLDTQFLLTNYPGEGFHNVPSGIFPQTDELVLSVKYPTEKAVAVVWLNCQLPDDRFLMHRTQVSDEDDTTVSCLRTMPNLIQPLWAVNGYRQDIGWIE